MVEAGTSSAPSGLSRRQLNRLLLLGLPGAAALAGRPAWAAAAAAERITRLTVAQLRHAGGWNPRPTALRRLLWELGKRTSVEVEADAAVLDPCDKALFTHPFAMLFLDGALPPLPACAEVALRTYLRFGGTLVVDAVNGGRGSPADLSVRRTFEPLLGAAVAPVPRDHVVYKSFYLLEAATGRVAACPDLDAISLDGRLALLLSHNDLAGAWARSNLGLWEHDVVPGGNQQREMAFRLGVNLLMYALCIDYKEDQVHIPFILKKRRR